MTGWEYRQTPASTDLGELNALGADGWEVVGKADHVEQDASGRQTVDRAWLLRRPVPVAAGMVTGD